jgi:hypothetical protein
MWNYIRPRPGRAPEKISFFSISRNARMATVPSYISINISFSSIVKILPSNDAEHRTGLSSGAEDRGIVVLKRRRVEDHPVFSTFHSYCQKV